MSTSVGSMLVSQMRTRWAWVNQVKGSESPATVFRKPGPAESGTSPYSEHLGPCTEVCVQLGPLASDSLSLGLPCSALAELVIFLRQAKDTTV